MNKGTKLLIDNLDNSLKVGDIIIRPVKSTFSYHKILGVTKNNTLILSVKRYPYKILEHTNKKVKISEGSIINTPYHELDNHNSEMYLKGYSFSSKHERFEVLLFKEELLRKTTTN